MPLYHTHFSQSGQISPVVTRFLGIRINKLRIKQDISFVNRIAPRILENRRFLPEILRNKGEIRDINKKERNLGESGNWKEMQFCRMQKL